MGVRDMVDSRNSILREKAAIVKKITGPIVTLLNDMEETMFYHNGLGLAAPQVGISRQVIVVNLGGGETLRLINPQVIESGGEAVDVEGCLSLPGVFGEIVRADEVVIEALDEKNSNFKISASGLLARVLQHEIDHLQGTLFIDKAIRLLDPEELEVKGENF